MSLGHGASIIRDGLVLHLDAANPKSYNPNMIEYSEKFNNAYWTNNGGTIFVSTTELAPDGSRTATTLEDDNSAGYEWISRAITVPNDNQTYSLSIFVRKTSGGTAPGFAVNTSLTGGTQVATNQRLNTDTGVVSSASVLDLGNYWRMYWTITNNTSGNTSLNVNIYPAARLAGGVSDTNTATGTATIWGMMITRGSTLLDYVPNAGKSSNIWYDLSGSSNNSNVTQPAVFSNSAIVLGSNGFISLPANSLSTSGLSNVSYSFVLTFNWNSITGYRTIFGIQEGSFNKVASFVLNTGQTQLEFDFRNGASIERDIFNKNMASFVNTPTHITYTFSSGVHRLYINGVLDSTYNGTATVFPTWTTAGFAIGENLDSSRLLESGEFASAMVYTKTLSEEEIRQNFEALRGRYSI